MKHLISVNEPHCKPTFETTHAKVWPYVALASFSVFPKVVSWAVEDVLYMRTFAFYTFAKFKSISSWQNKILIHTD